MLDVHHPAEPAAVTPPPRRSDASAASLPDGPLLSVEQVAEHLGVRPRWVYQRVQTGEIAALRLGRHLRFRPTVIAAYLELCALNAR